MRSHDPRFFPQLLMENFWLLGIYYFNIYYIKGSKASALIEMGVSAITDLVIKQLDFLNGRPDYLILTHPHADHLTGLDGLQKRFPDALVISGKGAEKFIAHPKAVEAMFKEDLYISNSLANLGVQPGRQPLNKPISILNNLEAERKFEVDLGGVILNILKIGGHSPGNVIVHIPDLNVLIVSDSLGFHYPGRGILPLYLTDFSDYVSTLSLMESLNPEMLCLAHQGTIPSPEVKGAFRTARESTFKILSRVRNERNLAELAGQIFTECYKDEFTVYSEGNIKSVAQLLVKRALEYEIDCGQITR